MESNIQIFNMLKMQHWIVRIKDGKSFRISMNRGIWGLISSVSDGKNFLSNASEGDILWFLTNYKAGNKIVAVATFTECKTREVGPLISFTATNEELGWPNGKWDTEVHFKDLYLIEDLDMQGNIKCRSSYVKTSSVAKELEFDFDLELKNIVKYSKAKKIN